MYALYGDLEVVGWEGGGGVQRGSIPEALVLTFPSSRIYDKIVWTQNKLFIQTKQAVYSNQTSWLFKPNKLFIQTKQAVYSNQTSCLFKPNKW